jgi:uncharacterized membrane protein YgcG
MSLTAIHGELEELKQHLRDLLADCGKSKEPKPPPVCDRSNIPDGYWMDSSCKLHQSTRFFGHIELGPIASNVERVQVDPGGGLAPKSAREKGPKKKPKNVHPLVWKLTLAVWDCQTKRVRANAAYYRCRAKNEGGTAESCRGLYVQVSCPEVEELSRQVAQMNAAASASGQSDGFSGQGGQFGGGGASGSF